jgi:hypothetical protein
MDIECYFVFRVILSIRQNGRQSRPFSLRRLAPVRGQPSFGRTAVDVAMSAPGPSATSSTSFSGRETVCRATTPSVRLCSRLARRCLPAARRSEMGERREAFERGRRPWPNRDTLQPDTTGSLAGVAAQQIPAIISLTYVNDIIAQITPHAWKNDFLVELFANLKRRHKCKMQIKFGSFGY